VAKQNNMIKKCNEFSFCIEKVDLPESSNYSCTKIHCNNLTGQLLEELSIECHFDQPVETVIRENEPHGAFFGGNGQLLCDGNMYTWEGINVDKDIVLTFNIHSNQPISIKNITFETQYKKIESITKKETISF